MKYDPKQHHRRSVRLRDYNYAEAGAYFLTIVTPGVETDSFVVMPNHFHGIIFLVGAGPRACPPESGQPQGVAPTMPLPDVVHRFKTLTTSRYADGVKQYRWAPF